jgi:hypothetical protein
MYGQSAWQADGGQASNGRERPVARSTIPIEGELTMP